MPEETHTIRNLVIFFLIILPLFTMSLQIPKAAGAIAKIYVEPYANTAEPGEQFTVDVKIEGVAELWAWSFYLNWTTSLLNVTSVTEGSFLNQEGAQTTYLVKKIYNNKGYLALWDTLQTPATSVSGSGTLATITFLVKAEGGSALDVCNTDLIKKGLWGNMESMPHTSEDGYFAYPMPTLYVDPPSIIGALLTPGSSFQINVSVANIEDLKAWSIYLKWTPALLNVTNISEGPFLSQGGLYSTNFTTVTYQELGYIYINSTLNGVPINTASGNGTLATITFLVEGGGFSLLDLYNTVLLDSLMVRIPSGEEDGYFANAVRDIAVINVEASSNTVKAGDSVSITVGVKNDGTEPETFNVTVSTPSPPSPSYAFHQTKNETSLAPGASDTLTFVWDTKGVTEGEYTIMAEASVLPEEIDIADNTFTMSGKIRVTAGGQEFPLTLIILGVAGVAIVGIGVFAYFRRKSHSA